MLIDPTQAILPSFAIAAGLAFFLHALAVRLRPVDGGVADANEGKHKDQPWLRMGIRFALSLSLATSVFVGVNLLRGSFSLPEKYWEWLGPIVVLAGILGPLHNALSWRWKLLTWPLLGFAAAWLLVPDWSTLEPTRQVYMPLFAAYLCCLGWLYEWGGENSSPRELLFSLCTTTATLAAATAAMASLKYGELAAIVFASLAAFFFVNLLVRFERHALTGTLPCIALLVGSVAFVGYIYPQPPLYELMLLPLAPVGLFVARKLSAAETVGGTAIRIGGCLTILLPIVVSLVVRYGFE